MPAAVNIIVLLRLINESGDIPGDPLSFSLSLRVLVAYGDMSSFLFFASSRLADE